MRTTKNMVKLSMNNESINNYFQGGWHPDVSIDDDPINDLINVDSKHLEYGNDKHYNINSVESCNESIFSGLDLHNTNNMMRHDHGPDPTDYHNGQILYMPSPNSYYQNYDYHSSMINQPLPYNNVQQQYQYQPQQHVPRYNASIGNPYRNNVNHNMYSYQVYQPNMYNNLNCNNYGQRNLNSNLMCSYKVPMAPLRHNNTNEISRKPPAPLLLPFHHKNDNRIIPQPFASHTAVVPHYSLDEIQESKSMFLQRYTELDFDNITVVELKAFLREFSLASGGKKDDLISRIKQINDYLISESNDILSSEGHYMMYESDPYNRKTY